MSNKDFLSQFSNENNKPASFNEEVRTPVQKEKKPMNPWFIVIPAIVVLTIGVVLYLLFIRPNIVVTNFIGQQKEDAVAWIRQQNIESNGIVFREEYDFDNDENIIIGQDPIDGKVTMDAKMTFVISKGPDPSEKINVPNFIGMDKTDITEWINKNKLLSTKINTTYSDTIENNKFIKADYTDCDEYSFTRGCSLKISISKGPKPADEVEMQNFVKKNIEELEVWAASKKINIEIVKSYSDSYPENQIMAQSAKEKDIIKVGDTVTVLVSKGKAVVMEDFVGKSYQDDFAPWKSKNSGFTAIRKERYSSDYSKGDIISQSIPAGKIIEEDLTIIVSLGEPDVSGKKTLEELRLWKQEVNALGADVHIGNETYENSDTVPEGQIIKMNYSKYVRVGKALDPVISKGKNTYLINKIVYKEDKTTVDPDKSLYWADAPWYNEDQIRELCDYNSISYEVKYMTAAESLEKFGIVVDVHNVITLYRPDEDGTYTNRRPVNVDEYISKSETVIIWICED